MATQAEPQQRHPARAFSDVFRSARREIVRGVGDVNEVRIALDGPDLWARSRLLSSRGVTFVLGENQASEAMTLRHDGAAPMIAVHAPLRGSAISRVDDLGRAITGRAGQMQLFSTPTARSTVHLRAHARNQALRIIFHPELLRGLATRTVEIERVISDFDAGRPFCASPMPILPPARLLDETDELLDSDHYGPLRPLFLESRALSWLAIALASSRQHSSRKALAPREIDRMHDARDLLLSRLGSPPTLAEVAKAVGTNDFTLKRHFKAVFGRPVHGYLLDLRLRHARGLLKDPACTVKEIAVAVGYLHPNHFSTAFRRWLGMTPGEYRAHCSDGRRDSASRPQSSCTR